MEQRYSKLKDLLLLAKYKSFLTIFSLLIFSSSFTLAQAPTWVATTPSTGTVGPTTIPLNYGINKVGVVYIVVFDFNQTFAYSSNGIKTLALAGPSGHIVLTRSLTVTAGNINTVLQTILDVTNPLTTHAIYIVAEGTPGGIQASPVRLTATTLACPKIDILTGFSQPQLCVNRGAIARFNVSVDPDPAVSGILRGTTWFFDWGDGTSYTYTSTADGDFPPLATRTHTYTTITDCNYIFTNTVRNPCGELRSVQYIAVVHGRDIPSDGDGQLDLVDNATGTQTVQVCAGTETIVTIRDNSTWNCQNPVLPGGFTAIPNTDPRNIEWLYGRDPAGGITNTITGTVAVATLGNAPAASGRISPVPYGPNSTSQAITIPATCQAGQFFRVYLKNWNKCNWLDPEFVDTYIDIVVIAAPPAPTAASRTICFGDTRTLTVTSPAVGTLTWYSDAALTTVVGNGANYTPPQTTPGIYNFWVTDQSLTGLQCMSQPTQVTLTIREDLARPGVISGPANTCPSVTGLVFSVPAVPMTMPFGGAVEFVWSVPAQLSITAGQGTRQITVSVDGSSGSRSISVYLRYVNSPNCNSNSRSTTLSVYSTTHNAGAISGSGICPGGTVNIANTTSATTGTPASSGPAYSWARAPGPGFSVWTSLAGTGATFSETLATTGTYRYRRTATFGCGSPVSTTVDIPVYSTVHDPGVITGSNICSGGNVSISNSTSASTGTPASSGPVYSWERAPGPGFSSWTSLSGSGATFSETVSTPGIYRYRRTATFGCGTPVTSTVDITVFSTSHNAGAIAGANICPGGLVSISNTTSASTGTPASTGPTYSWRRAPGPAFSSWTNLTGSAATFSETMSVPGTYRYQRRATFGCGSTVTTSVDIQVYSTTHNAGAITGTNACAGSPVTISSTTAASTGTPASSGPAYSWDRAPGPGFSVWTAIPGTGATLSETVATPGVYRYRRTATFGCGTPVSATTDVTIYSTAHNAGAIAGSTICAGGSVSITNTSAASTGTPASSGPVYSWDRAPGPGFSVWTALSGSGTSFSETMSVPGTYRYRRTATYGCGTPVSTTVDVLVNPLPSPVVSGVNNVCQHPSNTVAYSTPLVAGHTYSWSVTLGTISGASTGNSVNVIWNTVGTGTVRVTETITATGCSFTTPAYNVTVNPGPPATAPSYVSGATNICRNGTLNLDVTNVATAIEYIWDYSWIAGTNNASTASSQISIDLSGLAPGSYSVTVAGSNGCGTGPWMTPAHNFNINDIPDLASLDNTVCSDAASAITLSVANPGPTITGLTYNISSINMNGLTASAGSPATGTVFPAGIISDDSYTNKTAANVNVVYAIIPVSSQGCTGAQENVTLTVRPEPVLASLNSTECSDEALGFNLSTAAGSSAASSYNITGINPNGLTASAGSPATGNLLPATIIADDAWRNTGSSPVNVVYSIVPVGSNGCLGDTYTMTITVNPEPILANLNSTVCSDSPLGFSLSVAAGSVAATAYNIMAINANGLTASAGSPSTGTSLPANVIANDAWTNTTASPVNVEYTIVPVSAAGCLGDPRIMTITVNPEPTLAALSNTVCSDSPSLITLAVAGGSVAATTYNITAINNGGLTASAGSPATGNGLLASVISDDAWMNKTSGNVNVVYTVVPVSASGCAGNPVSVTLIVRPEPVLASLNTTKCSDEAFGFNLSLAAGSTPAASYNITAINANGLTASAGSPATGTGLAANVVADDAWTNTTNAPVSVVYSIIPVGSNGCLGDTYTMTVTINPEPVLAALNTTKCSDEALGFNLAVAAGSVAASTYNITAINANGLTASAGAPATGSSLPANVISNDAWTNTTGSPVNVIYTVVPVSASGCAGNPGTITITINPEPVLANLNTTLCSDAALGFNLSVAAGSVAASTYNITSINNNGLTASAGSPATGTGLSANVIADDSWTNTTPLPVNVIYTVIPVSSDGCAGNPATVTITVNPEPVMATPGTTKCSREALAFNLAVNAGGVAAATYNITSINPNGLTASAGSPATGSSLPANIIADDAWINITSANVNVVYTIVPVSAAGCEGNPATVTITVKPEPVISAGQTLSSCSGNALNYAIGLDNFTNPADGVLYTWPAPVLNPGSPLFTGGSARAVASSANITDTFINTLGIIGTATYTITPYKDGCAGIPVIVVISVGSEPVLDPGLDNTVCSNVATGLVLREAPGSVTPSHYNISAITIESGLIAAAGNAAIPNATAPATYLSGDIFINRTGVDKTVTYRIQPILAPDCFGDPEDVIITVRPEPVILPGQTKTVCSGVSIDKEIFLVPANTPAGTLFSWGIPVMSDGSVQGTAQTDVSADPAGKLHIMDIIQNYSSAPITATYTITPVSQFGCAGTPIPVVITINQEPVPQPVSGRINLCVGDMNVVYNVNPVGGSTFHWTVDPLVGVKTFDFNTNAILINAALTPGSGNVTVYETNSLGCSGDPSHITVNVSAQHPPEDLAGDPVVCALSTHTYSVTNRAGSVYNWTVPGGAAIIGNPSASSISVIFGNVGGTILVRETNIAGCVTNHNPFSVLVNPLPTANITNGGDMCDGGTRPLNVNFTGTAPFNFTYAINGVPQAPVSTSDNPYIINATLAGTYSVVNITDNTGCTNTGSGTATITYFPKPTGIISGNAELCRGSSATLTMTFTGVAPYTFTYTDGSTPVTVTGHPSNVYTVSVSPLVTSTYTLTSLTDLNSCSGVLSGAALINVNQPTAITLAGTNLICYNVPTGAVDMTISGGTPPFGISWNGPSGFTSPAEDISGLNEGYYTVTIIDSKGCSSSANITLTQPAQLNASFTGANATCFGANNGSITITGATGGFGTYEYSINGGASWAATDSYTNVGPGTYVIMIRDAVNPTCMRTINPGLVITQPAALNATVASTNVTCFGANNGSITITSPSGGSGSYQYSVDGGVSWSGSGTFTSLTAGNYDVRIRDAVHTGCSVVLNPALGLTEPPVLSATLAQTNISCYGSSDGTITISGAAGGHGTYEYSINGGGSWQATGNYAGLIPGTYNVQIRDAAYPTCYVVLNNALVLSQPAILSATVTSTNVTCNKADDGSINISGAAGGNGSYEYTINGGTTWYASGLFNGLAPGTYDVRIRVTGNSLCQITLNPGLQISEPAALTAMVVETDISCFGAANGNISITNSAGGYGTFQYTIDGGATWQDSPMFSYLTAGTYDVRIRDRIYPGCEVVLDPAVQITEPAALNAVLTRTNVTCNGANDGTITISSPTGGYGTYAYSINGGASWQGSGSFTGVAPGTYNVRMRDALNPACYIILNPALAITQPAPLNASVVSANISCFGANDGSITISGATGGYGTYEYTINGGASWQSSGSYTSLTPGFYNVRMRDALNPACMYTINASLNITEPAILSANVTRTNVTCNGAGNGTITITNPLGGYGTYEFSINGGGAWQSSGSFTGLIPGTYNVRMRDAAHPLCINILNAALIITEPAPLTATLTSVNITCSGAGNGIISLSNPSGGYGTYEYSIDGGSTWSGAGNFTGLVPGTYDVRIRDAAFPTCRVILNPSLVITQPAVLHADVASTNVTCFGGSDGTITITNPAGGYGTYEYTINGGGAWQSSGTFTGLGPGNYNVQIRDAANTTCIIVLNNALVITQPAILRATVTPTMVSCNGAGDGIITITSPLGGSGSYEYSADGGSSWQVSGTFAGLSPDIYDVRIRDAANNSCVIVLNSGLVITEPAVLSAVVASGNITCFGANDGSVRISSPTGGYGTYEYSVNGGVSWQNNGTFSSLTPGTYDVRIRDRAHITCFVILDPALVITEPSVLSATVSVNHITCNGANDGSIVITNPAGGYGNYAYTVNGGANWQSSGTFSNLGPGMYDVRIRDAVNITCQITLDPALEVTEPAKLDAIVASTNVTCNGANNGTITISFPSGGYGTYEYSINGGGSYQLSGNFINLAPGFYNVLIRDAAHPLCVSTLNGSLRITEPNVLNANVTYTNISCNGANDGTITISSPTGGYSTYEFSISGGASWQASGIFTGLLPGNYDVRIRDAAYPACVIILNPALHITEPAPLAATIVPVNISCFGADNGIISITGATGGFGTYDYSINGGTTWSGINNFSGLAPGTYDVRMRDAANISCVVTLNPALLLTQPNVLHADISSTNITCFGGNDGTITLSNPTGGYGTYEYSINGGGSWQSSGTFSGLTPGAYNILIRDAAHTSCIIVLNNSYILTQPALLSATVGKTDVSCSGNNDGTISVTSPSGGYGTYEYSINGGMSWSTTGSFTGLLPGTYDIRIRDAAHIACSSVLYPNLVISEPLPLTLSTTGDVALDCFGDTDGFGTFYAFGGTMPYTFLVVSNTTGGLIAAPGFNSQAFFNAGAGSITIQVIDANMCSAQATINLTQPADLNPGSIAADQIVCFGDSPATLTELTAPSGATGTYLFQWQQSTSASGPFINIAGASLSQYTPPAAASYTLYYRRMVSSGVCMPVYSNVVEVLVNPRPVAYLTGGETICPGNSSILRVNMLAGTGPFEIDIAGHGTVTNYTSGTDIIVSPLVTTTYTLTRVRDANNCEVLAPSPNINGSATVTVSDLPSITSFTPAPDVCEFTLASFRVTATGTNLTYQWYVNDGGGFDPVTDGGTYFGALTPTLQIFNTVRSMNGYIYHVVVSGCGTDVQSIDAVLTVNTAPEITVHPSDTSICLGQNTIMEADASGSAVTWQWYVNKGAGFVLSVDDANFSGSQTRTLTITNALSSFNGWVFRALATGVCGVPVNTNFAVLRVINPPVVTLQPLSRTICENGSVTLTGNGSGYTSLQWQVYSGGMWTNLTDNATYLGTNTQQLAIINAPVAFNGNEYRLALISVCSTVFTNPAILRVNANPVVDFSTIDPVYACGGVPLNLNGNPSGGSGTYTQHRWTGDVGPLNNYTIQNPVFSSWIPGTYNLNYRVTDSNGCTSNDDLSVMLDSPTAQFSYDIGSGCKPLTVSFTKDMTGISKWWWDFDDGSPLDSINAAPVHTFAVNNPGSIEYYAVNLRVMSPGGCYAEYTVNIIGYPSVSASFTPDVPVICSGNSITFTALSGATRYFWDYGDGTSGYATHSTNHLYTNFTTAPVVHTVRLTTTSFYNCVDVRTYDITVMPVPIPQFVADPSSQVYNSAGNPVTFTNTTNPGTWNWLWEFGDNTTSTDMSPVHSYGSIGTYEVTLTVSNANCSESISHEVFVMPPAPVADFDSIPSGCAPLYVSINNTTLNADLPGTTYHWDFGDGSKSTAKNPTYTYFTPGNYRIELIVDGPGGTSMKTQVVNAYPSPQAYFEVTPVQVYANDERVRMFNLSSGATSYLWDFGDGDTSKVKEPYHKYLEEGVYDITLWAYSANGCMDQYILSPAVTVLPVGEIRYPTVFIPNKTGPIERSDLPTGGTEVDQFFYPPIRETVVKYKLQIFNRLGVLIFESSNINVPWNGYYKGELCQQGVYVWLVEGKYQDGKPFKLVGNVTLLH